MIEQANLDEACERLIAAISANRLVVLCGAGLSMADPSNLPSAAAIAAKARETHIGLSGAAGDEIPEDLGDLAEYFFDRDELKNYFIPALIDRNSFAARPNAGHLAIADLILTQSLEAVISANVDGLIESAGQYLFGQIEVFLSGADAAAVSHIVSPLLKIHGCWSWQERPHTVWTLKQLDHEPVKSRIEESARWLRQKLRNKDVLVIGFWSDWAYLNEILGTALGVTLPARVTIFDPAETDALSEKAPDICALSEHDEIDFKHVQISGATALETLRISFSKAIIRNILRSARAEFENQSGAAPDDDWLEPPDIDARSLWSMRRDLHGCKPNIPDTNSLGKEVSSLIGLTLLKLCAAGASADGEYWRLRDVTIRVINTLGDFMHNIMAAYERETPPLRAADIVICVLAQESAFLSNVVRGKSQATFARGGSLGQWLTHGAAFEKLGL